MTLVTATPGNSNRPENAPRPRWSRSVPVWALCAFVLVFLIALRPDSDGPVAREDSPSMGGRVVIGVQQEPERLCELLSGTATNNLIGSLLNGRFVKYTPDLELIPDLIERIPTVANGGISADMLTYTYRLRKGAQWHDGRPLTSGDVKFTVDVIMDPAVNVESRDGWRLGPHALGHFGRRRYRISAEKKASCRQCPFGTSNIAGYVMRPCINCWFHSLSVLSLIYL